MIATKTVHHSLSEEFQLLKSLNNEMPYSKNRACMDIVRDPDLLPIPSVQPKLSTSTVATAVNVLRLLDNLHCPLLLLPWAKENNVKKIAFLTDIRFTDAHMMTLLMNNARSMNASVVLINIAEPALPPMEQQYAHNYFRKNLAPRSSGIPVQFVNLAWEPGLKKLQVVLKKCSINIVASAQRRKDLLYSLADHL